LKDYFSILGIKPGADPQDVRRAFKELAFQYHPDRNPHNPSAEEKFKEIAEAYAYLSGNQELLEAVRESPRSAKVNQALGDIYDDIFGIDMSRWTPPGKDLYQGVDLTLKEAFFGVDKKFTIWREVVCSDCNGRGAPLHAKAPTCTFCFGRGAIRVDHRTVKTDKICPKCHGTGRLPSEICNGCRGRGVKPAKEKVGVSIPARVRSGQEVRVPGLGSLAARSERPGDLVLQVFVKPEERFTFDGPDLLCQVSVSFAQAEEGGPLKVATVGGEAEIDLPRGVASGSVFRLKGMGLGGDQLIRVFVKPSLISETPPELSQARLSAPDERALAVTSVRRSSLWSKIKNLLFG